MRRLGPAAPGPLAVPFPLSLLKTAEFPLPLLQEGVLDDVVIRLCGTRARAGERQRRKEKSRVHPGIIAWWLGTTRLWVLESGARGTPRDCTPCRAPWASQTCASRKAAARVSAIALSANTGAAVRWPRSRAQQPLTSIYGTSSPRRPHRRPCSTALRLGISSRQRLPPARLAAAAGRRRQPPAPRVAGGPRAQQPWWTGFLNVDRDSPDPATGNAGKPHLVVVAAALGALGGPRELLAEALRKTRGARGGDRVRGPPSVVAAAEARVPLCCPPRVRRAPAASRASPSPCPPSAASSPAVARTRPHVIPHTRERQTAQPPPSAATPSAP